MTASRIGGSSGMAAIAAEIPASRFSPSVRPRATPASGDEGDQPDRHDEQDPDEPVELALERRPAALLRGEAAGDPPDLGRRADGDDDALAAAADDARPGVGHRAAGREPFVDRGRREAARLGDGLAGEQAPVDEQPVDPPQPQVGRDHVAGPEEDDVTRARGPRPATSRIVPSRRTRLIGALASRSASSARSPRYSVKTSAPTIGASASRTSTPSRTSPSRDREDARDHEQDDERLGRGLDDEPPDGRAALTFRAFGPTAAARRSTSAEPRPTAGRRPGARRPRRAGGRGRRRAESGRSSRRLSRLAGPDTGRTSRNASTVRAEGRPGRRGRARGGPSGGPVGRRGGPTIGR